MHPVSFKMTVTKYLPMNGEPAHHDHFATRSIHVGSEPDPFTGAVVPSLSVATTFKQDGVGKDRVSDLSSFGLRR